MSETRHLIKVSPDQAYITAGQHQETGKYHSMLWRSHPKPSGSDRWLLSVSGNNGHDQEIDAKLEMAKALPAYPVFINDKEGYYYPFFPERSEQTVKKYDLSCRICNGNLGGDYDIPIVPEMINLKCAACDAPAQVFNGIVIQDNGECSFDIPLEANPCKLCGLAPAIEFWERRGDEAKKTSFSVFCDHHGTLHEIDEYDDDFKKPYWLENVDLHELVRDWNKLHVIEGAKNGQGN